MHEYEIIKILPPEGGPDAPFSVSERIIAQRNILASLGETTEEEREQWLEENSGPFRELEKDPEFRRLVREENFDEVRARLEAFKEKQKGKSK